MLSCLLFDCLITVPVCSCSWYPAVYDELAGCLCLPVSVRCVEGGLTQSGGGSQYTCTQHCRPVTTFLTTTRRWETFTHNSLLLVLLTIVNLATHNLGPNLYHPPLHYLRCIVISNSWVTTSYHGVTKTDGWLIEPDSPRLWVVSSVRCSKYPPIIYSSILHVRYFLHCLLCSDQGVGQVWLGAWRGGGHWTLDSFLHYKIPTT